MQACFCPESLDEALALLDRYGADLQVCAGGTDLLVMMRKRALEISYLMDISALGLTYIRENPDATLSVGAAATLSSVARSRLLDREPYLCLQQAAAHVGSQQIRNMATLVGNICTGIPSADCAVPLLALDGRVKLVSSHRIRILPLTVFFESPRKTVVQPNELVMEIILEQFPKSPTQRSFFRKVGTRKELFISIFSAAAWLRGDNTCKVEHAGLSMGVAAPVPVRLLKTESFLTGKKLEDPVIAEALEIMQTEISPRSSHHGSEEYRRSLASNILRRFLIETHISWQQR